MMARFQLLLLALATLALALGSQVARADGVSAPAAADVVAAQPAPCPDGPQAPLDDDGEEPEENEENRDGPEEERPDDDATSGAPDFSSGGPLAAPVSAHLHRHADGHGDELLRPPRSTR